MFRVVIAAAALSMSSQALAQASGAASVFGVGLMKCSDWTSAKAEPIMKIAFEAYAVGYMTGMNRTVSSFHSIDILKNVDPREQLLKIDIECEATPTKSVANAIEGVAAFYLEAWTKRLKN